MARMKPISPLTKCQKTAYKLARAIGAAKRLASCRDNFVSNRMKAYNLEPNSEV